MSEQSKRETTSEVIQEANKPVDTSNNNPTTGTLEELNQMVKDIHMSLPELSDFEEGAIDTRIYEELAKKLGDSTEQTLFYKENPPLENTGIDRLRGLAMVSLPPSAFRITKEDLHAGFVDGDTLYADLRKADVTDPELLDYLSIGQQNMRAYLAGKKIASEDINDENNVKDQNRSLSYDMGFRFLYYDAPEVHHWSVVYASDVKEVTYAEAINDYKAFTTKAYDVSSKKDGSEWKRYKDTDTIRIAKINESGKWIQINTELTDKRFNNPKTLRGRVPVFGLMADETNYATLPDAYKAANDVVDILNSATEVRAIIDINSSSKQDQTTAYPRRQTSILGSELISNYYNAVANAFRSQDPTVFNETGINAYGLEHYRRNLAVIYVKTKDGQWINLNKYVIARNRNISVLKYSDFSNPNLKPWTYQFDAKAWADAVWNAQAHYDNRHLIQNKAFGWNTITQGLDSISDWTCTIGDVTLFVPPISINTVTQAYTNSVPLIRAKGSANIENAKPERFLQLELYFNEDRGINGQPVKWRTNQSNKQTEVVYHMNGLRALLAEFKFAPYMPIENKYINEVLDIDAICFESISVATVPNYPKLLKVVLLLKEFDYQVFMPQVPKQRDLQQGSVDIYRNFFAKTINYDLLRWYIQRPLQLGNELHEHKMHIATKDFMKKTLFANRSAFIPVDTLSPYINIYMPDEDKLSKMEKVRQTYSHSSNKAPNYYRPSEKDKDLFAIANQYYKTIQNERIKKMLDQYIINDNNKLSVMATAGNDIVNYLKSLNIVADYSIQEKQSNIIKELTGNDPGDYTNKKITTNFDTDTSKDYIIVKIYPPINYYNRDESLLLRQQFVSTLTSGSNPNMSDAAKNSVSTDNYDNVFTDNTFKLKIYLTDKNKLEFYPYDSDSKFLEYCASQYASVQSGEGEKQLTGNEELYENYEDSEFERPSSIEYRLYLEDVLVQGLTANFSNTYANMTLNTYHGQAPQFMGGQDATLTFSVMTYDKETVDRFDKIPKIISYFKKKYPNALPSYPFRIDSEFTKLLGIFEVIVEQVAISTVPNYPGLFQINVTLRQTDRTLRNKHAIYKQFEQSNFASKLATTQRANQSALGYFEIDQNLSKAELYPDLELPTIKELGEAGFEFVRYKNARDQVFVDPDFYYMYYEHLFSELLRDCILQDSKMLQMFNAKQNGEISGELKLVSEEGEVAQHSLIHGMITDNGGISEMNARDWKLTQDKLNEMRREENDQRLKLYKSGIATGQWKVGKSIGVTFLEPYYAWLYYNLNNKKTEPKKDAEVKDSDEALKSVIVDSINTFQWEADKALKFLAETSIEAENAEKDLYQHFKNIIVETKSVDKSIFKSWDNDIKKWLNQFSAAAVVTGLSTELEPEKQKEYLQPFLVAEDEVENGGQYGTFAPVGGIKVAGKTLPQGSKTVNVKNYNPTRYTINGITYIRHMDDNSDFYYYGSCTELGPYAIPCFTQKEMQDNPLLQFLPVDYEKRRKKFVAKGRTFVLEDRYYFIDPYYQVADYDETIRYMKSCMTNLNFAKHAFLRNLLYWLCVLIKKNIYPNYMTDILFQNSVSEASAYEFMKEMKLANTAQAENIETLKSFVKDNQDKFVRGKLFVATALSSLSRDNNLMKLIMTRDYNALNALTNKVITPNVTITAPLSENETKLRKLLYGLTLSGLVEQIEELGVDIATDNPLSQIQRQYMQQLELEANSMEPEKLARRIRDSYLNMIQTDVRGRMLRGFPTFQIMFIDEGASSGFWKMHDSFYSTNAVTSIQVVKSKNIAADTAIIQLNNLYQNILAEYDADGMGDNFTKQLEYGVAGIENLYESIFNPRTYVRKLSEKQSLIPERNSIKLVAGARMHIRMGYSADAAKLPIMFNGTVTEIQGGDVATIVGQGDGIELSNPIREDNFGDRIKNRSTAYFGESPYGLSFGGVSPRVLVSSFLTCEDQNYFGRLAREKNWNILSRVLSNNPFGIYHYGDSYFRDIFVNGEPVQNLYEVTNDNSAHYYNYRHNTDILPSGNKGLQLENGASEQGQQPWYRSLASAFLIDPPEQGHQFVSIKTQGRTVWDILQFAASANPAFIGATDNFGFRSTAFLGIPNWYYAYKYVKHNNNINILEKRKPYSQFHMYWSDHDILSNQIETNMNRVSTVAKGNYQFEDVKKSTPDIYFDRDIYPEYQRSMVVDTWLHGRSQVSTSSENTFNIDSEIGSLDNYATISGLVGAGAGAVGGTVAGGTIGGAAGTGIGAAIGTALELGVKKVISWGVSNFAPDNYGGPEHNHAQTARLMTISRLKKSVEQIYSGNLIVYGDPSVKPHDRISIYDEPSSMTGQARVREVVHTLSATTGFVTTITPDAIVDQLNDKTTQLVNTSIFSTMMRYAIYATGIYNIQRSYQVQALLDDAAGLFVRTTGWAKQNVGTQVTKTMQKRTASLERIVDRLTKKRASILKELNAIKSIQSETPDLYRIALLEMRLASTEAKLARYSPLKAKQFSLNNNGVVRLIKSWANANDGYEQTVRSLAKKIYESRLPEYSKIMDELIEFERGKDKFIQEEWAKEYAELSKDRKGQSLKQIDEIATQKATARYDAKHKALSSKVNTFTKKTTSLINDVKSINNTKKGQEILSRLQKEGTITKKALDLISKDVLTQSQLGKLFNRLANTPAGKYLGRILNFGGKIGGNVYMMAAAYMLGRWGDMLSDFISNYKTLCITPLLKRGVPFIPSLQGAIGTVYLAPNWGQRGPILDFMDDVFNQRMFKGEETNFIKGSLSWILNASMGGGPGDAIERYALNADGNMYANNMGGDYEYTSTQNYVDGLLQRGSIRSVEQLLMRNSESSDYDKQEIRTRAEQFMHTTKDLVLSGDLAPLTPVPGPEFDLFKQTKFLVVRHEKAVNNDESSSVVEFSINQGGKSIKLVGIKGKDGDGNEVIDAPLLHPFALNTFRKIISQAEQMLSYKMTTDKNTYINKVSSDYITLASCYLFNSQKIYPASGFGFTLVTHGESQTNVGIILDAMQENNELIYQTYDNEDGRVYQVNVNVPKFGV